MNLELATSTMDGIEWSTQNMESFFVAQDGWGVASNYLGITCSSFLPECRECNNPFELLNQVPISDIQETCVYLLGVLYSPVAGNIHCKHTLLGDGRLTFKNYVDV